MTTTTMTPRAAADTLAADLIQHPRICTLILDGKKERAADMLFMRVESLCHDFARGEVDSADDDVISALHTLTNTFGVLARLEMRLAVLRAVDIMGKG